ncbi:MAG: bifunctional phosphopantothenoylcysteine decarboxylase/phosphopantothenate--cysteine ligase CoaBC [Actinomycetota bacterium]|nr:bifunctional phosphopantothenoylcysteine decarboxylase/phosphopantothenate--cysteine ligase CoaBC [Actinomycetota bacterium]
MSESVATPILAGKRIVLGVTGGIAAYKSVEVLRRLVDLGAHVVPVLTTAALNMVGPTTFTALASERVKMSLWDDPDPIPHTTLGQSADLIVVCPATARILADYRMGRSADLLSATLIATVAPVIVCPAMHTEMWDHPAVQENLQVLGSRGVHIVPPEEGRLAGGDIGKGRLATPEAVVAAVCDVLVPARRRLAGRTVLITAGGTREPIDPVRYIGNRSSGKQGYAIAREADRRGAKVTLVSTVELPAPAGVEVVTVSTAAEMERAVKAVAPGADIVVMSAAVADFRPVGVADQKIKKGQGVPQIRLEPTVDILAGLGAVKPPGQVLVGFAAETEDLASNAQDKLRRKNADMIVANDVSAPGVGFGHETNAVTIHRADGSSVEVALQSKDAIAAAVLDAAEALLPASAG